MKFWDSSAIVPLLVEEESTDAMMTKVRDDRDLIVWWGTPVECASAIARLERDGAPVKRVAEAFARLDTVAAAWTEVEPHRDVRDVARRLLRVHPLRAADALQLAAAYIAAEGRPSSLEVVTFDDRVRLAAAKEGFIVAPE
jgi:hypothetical protein